jgi:hypothetical protein
MPENGIHERGFILTCCFLDLRFQQPRNELDPIALAESLKVTFAEMVT